MAMDETFILNELKSLILSKTGIRTITPADCKRISIEISKTLNKNVSETTIKRLFGFAVVKHNFSKFTLTTLSEYVSEEHLDDSNSSFGMHTNKSLQTWKDVHDKIRKITSFTLKSIKNRSGMPYEMTISRKFAEHDFEDFFKSNYSFTCFISQPGYGRTILLSHLADSFINSKLPIYKDSAILFITAYTFVSKEHVAVNFEDQLKLQIGISPKDSLIDYANKHYSATGGKLIIMIDGFAELLLKRGLKKQLFESIINFICAVEDNKSIKLIMSMRSTTWTRFYDCIRHSSYLKTKWFPGNYFNLNTVSNIPPLTEKEVNLILSKIHHLDAKDINEKLKTQLKFPFHIQLYYQLKEEDPDFNYSTNITFYELISRFIQDKIYRSNYYTEKILFLKKVVRLTNFGNQGTSVLKDELIGELSAFKNAYMELLSDGILMEEKSQEQFHPREFVRFVHPHIFEYFLFIELLEKFHLKIDQIFFENIRDEYAASQSKFQLLQWTIRFLIKTGDMGALASVFDLELDNYERRYLVLFIAENLDYRAKYDPGTTTLLNTHGLHKLFINELINLDLADPFYKESLIVILRITNTENDLIIYNSLLAIFDIFTLDPRKIDDRLKILATLNAENWPVNPYQIVTLIRSKIMSDRIDKAYINHFSESLKVQHPDNRPESAISNVMIALFGIFAQDNHDNSNSIETLLNQYTNSIIKGSSTVFGLSVYVLFSFLMSQDKQTAHIKTILDVLDQTNSSFRFTRYSECIIGMLKGYKLKNEGKYLDAYNQCIEPMSFFKANHLNINCLFIYNLVIEIFTESNDLIKADEYKYERLCFIEENNIPNLLFAQNNEVRN